MNSINNRKNKIYLYCGDEKYLTSSKIERVIKESNATEINTITYDLLEDSIDSAIYDALSPAFLGDNKVVILLNPLFLENEKGYDLKALYNYLKAPVEGTYLIINAVGIKINEKQQIYKELEKKANIITTNGISKVEYMGWLERECECNNLKIQKSAIEYMYNTYGTDLIASKNEIDKIIAYCNYEGVITEELVRSLVFKESSNAIYTLINAIFDGNKKKAIEIYLEISSYEKDTMLLVNRLSKAFKDIMMVKTMVEENYSQDQIAKELKITSGRAYYLIKDASKFKTERLKEIIHKLTEMDYKIKTGKIINKLGFEEFLYGI